MSNLEGHYLLPDEFEGVVRLFPLPSVVVFPHIVQALHVFELRYREMLEEAVAGDRLIAMGLLSPGWEKDYVGRPPIRDVVCIGRVISHARLEGGQYNLLLLGLRRARIVHEMPPRKSFREARVELLDDVYQPTGDATRNKRRRRLLNRFRKIVPKDPAAQQQIDQLLGNQISLGMLTDLVAYSLHLDAQQKQRLLNEVDVDRRAECLLAHLDRIFDAPSASGPLSFPPQFSAN